MGIKGWLFIGAGLALTALVWLGLKREEDLCAEKAEKIIREVDGNKKEEEIPSVDEMADDVEKAFREMGLDKEADAYIGAKECLERRHQQAVKGMRKAAGLDEPEMDFGEAVETIVKKIDEELGEKAEDILERTDMGNGENGKEWLDRCFDRIEKEHGNTLE